MMRYALGAGQPALAPLQLVLGRTHGARIHANFRSDHYYVSPSVRAFAADVVDSLPSGQPTSAGLLVDGGDAPTLARGYGEEELPNGDFTDGTNGWWPDNATLDVVDGRLKVASTTTSYAQSNRAITLVAGATYLVSGVAEAGVGVSSARLDFWDGAVQHTILSSSGADVSGSALITAVSANCVVKLNQYGSTIGREASFDNISIKRVFPFPGYSGTEHTVRIVWDANSVTGDRVVWDAQKDANNRLTLHFVSGILRLESFVAGVSEGFVGAPGVDDGGAHSAILYWDEVSGTLSLDVDGQGLEGPELVTNGGMTTETDWTKGAGWAITGGQAVGTSVGAFVAMSQTASLTEGVVYRPSVEVSAYTSGNVRFGLAGGTTLASSSYSTLGVYSEDLVAVSGNNLFFFGSANQAFTGAIDNISVRATYTRSGLTLPSGLNLFALGHLDGTNRLNGLVLEHAAATGDQITVWRDIPF